MQAFHTALQTARLRVLALAVTLVALAVLAAGAGAADAARSCSQDKILIPYGSTANGSETQGYCIRAATDPIGQSRVDSRYSEIASAIIKRYAELKGVKATDALVICWNQRDWNALSKTHANQFGDGLSNIAGYVMMPWNVINLSPKTCRELDRIVYQGGKASIAKSSWEISTLAHEALHVAGVSNEATTECYAMQLTTDAAQLLGESKAFGASVARDLYGNYPGLKTSDPAYYTSKCKNGTPLDLRPGQVLFP
ncbi:MAG: hypothetical protein WKF41_17780 [Gaiellaceae bacterium]